MRAGNTRPYSPLTGLAKKKRAHNVRPCKKKVTMELFQFLTGTTGGKCLFTMLVSMLPIIELRGGVPFGMAVLDRKSVV